MRHLVIVAALPALGCAACSQPPGNGPALPATAVPSGAIACTPAAITKGLLAHGDLKIPKSKVQSYACKDGRAIAAIDAAVKPAVQRRGAQEISEADPIEPLNSRVPPHDRRAEQAAGIFG